MSKEQLRLKTKRSNKYSKNYLFYFKLQFCFKNVFIILFNYQIKNKIKAR